MDRTSLRSSFFVLVNSIPCSIAYSCFCHCTLDLHYHTSLQAVHCQNPPQVDSESHPNQAFLALKLHKGVKKECSYKNIKLEKESGEVYMAHVCQSIYILVTIIKWLLTMIVVMYKCDATIVYSLDHIIRYALCNALRR